MNRRALLPELQNRAQVLKLMLPFYSPKFCENVTVEGTQCITIIQSGTNTMLIDSNYNKPWPPLL